MPIKPITPGLADLSRARRAAGVALAAVACTSLISACGSSSSKSSTAGKATNLNTARVARSIQQSILAERHLKAKVVCPALVAQEPGKTFECVATTRAAKKRAPAVRTPFLVTVHNSKGYVTYVGK